MHTFKISILLHNVKIIFSSKLEYGTLIRDHTDHFINVFLL